MNNVRPEIEAAVTNFNEVVECATADLLALKPEPYEIGFCFSTSPIGNYIMDRFMKDKHGEDEEKPIERFVKFRQDLDVTLGEKKRLEKEVNEVSEEIIGQMEGAGVKAYKSQAGYGISKGVRRSAQIDSYRELEAWAEATGNDEIREIWGLLQQDYKLDKVEPSFFTMQPQRKLLNIMLKYYAFFASQTGRDINDVLPPGLKQKATEYLILRKPSKKADKEEFLNTADSIIDLARKGALRK